MSYVTHEIKCPGCHEPHSLAIEFPFSVTAIYGFICPATKTEVFFNMAPEAKVLHHNLPSECIKVKQWDGKSPLAPN
ncbi:MAG TPA: hypothetical protein VNH11_27205 [Pirellulales bacterium]|nr:hypothetical protein [Pirellulales bacterium]